MDSAISLVSGCTITEREAVRLKANSVSGRAGLDSAVGACGSTSSSWSGLTSGSSTSWRSEEHTSELQSRFGISYAVFCLKKTQRIERPTLYTRCADGRPTVLVPLRH